MHVSIEKREVSFAWPWENWVRNKTRPTTYANSGSCNLNTLQRRTHMLVGIRKEFKNKEGHLGSLCAIPNQKNRCETEFLFTLDL